MKAVWALAFIATVTAGAPPGVAGMGDRHAMRVFERHDLDGDGVIGRDENRLFGDMRFQRWDRDSDGVVTEAEMVEAAQERAARRMAKMFARLDTNGDGRLEYAELEAMGAARFDGMDADGDGRLSLEEAQARWQARQHSPTSGAGSED